MQQCCSWESSSCPVVSWVTGNATFCSWSIHIAPWVQFTMSLHTEPILQNRNLGGRNGYSLSVAQQGMFPTSRESEKLKETKHISFLMYITYIITYNYICTYWFSLRLWVCCRYHASGGLANTPRNDMIGSYVPPCNRLYRCILVYIYIGYGHPIIIRVS